MIPHLQVVCKPKKHALFYNFCGDAWAIFGIWTIPGIFPERRRVDITQKADVSWKIMAYQLFCNVFWIEQNAMQPGRAPPAWR